jgi:hypothetical protein
MKKSDEARGKHLLTAVERLVASNEKLRAVSAECLAAAKATDEETDVRARAAAEVVRRYSNKAALLGGASGVPSLIPGAGIAIGLGAAVAEWVVLLKLEVEMALALLDLYGFDLDDPKERQLGFLLASVGTYDAGTGSNFFVDVAKVPAVATWNYAPRRVARWVVQAMALIVALKLWAGFAKMIPVLGIAVGSSMNKVLTTRVGKRVQKDVHARRELLRREARTSPAPKVKAASARRPSARRRSAT